MNATQIKAAHKRCTPRSKQRGRPNWMRVLSAEEVTICRQEFDAGRLTIRELATTYDINYSTMYGAVKRLTWKHIV
jgi:hypothetical protein